MTEPDWHGRLVPLLGKQVKVTLSEDDPQGVSVGQFLGFGDGGDLEILEHDGFVHHCWPLLHVEEVTDEQPQDRTKLP